MTTIIDTQITSTFADVKARHSLTEGTTYSMQNTGSGYLILVENATAPTESRGNVVGARETWFFTVGAQAIYVRSSGASGEAVFNATS